MHIIFEEFYRQRDKTAKPNRTIKYIDVKTTEYENIISTKKASNSNCIFEDSEFQISPLHVALIKEASRPTLKLRERSETNNTTDKNNKVGKRYSFNECLYYLYRLMYYKVNNCCIPNFKSTNKTDTGYTSYAYCFFETCNSYVFKAKVNTLGGYDVKVTTNATSILHTCYYNEEKRTHEIIQKYQQVRGPLRDVYMELLEEKKAYAVRNILLLQSSEYLLMAGISEVTNEAVMRQIKYEKNQLFSIQNDPYEEIADLKNKKDFIVFYSKEPFNVYLRNTPLIVKAFDVKNRVGYYDASGTMIGHPEKFLNILRKKNKEPPKKFKKIFFYPLVTKINGNFLPLITLITDEHTSKNLGNFIKEFKDYCTKDLKMWPIVKKVMMDFAPAEFIAHNYGYNGIGTIQYIQKMFYLMERDMDVEKDFIVPQGCCSHLAKIVSNDIDRYVAEYNKEPKHLIKINLQKSTKRLIQESMALASSLYNYKSMWTWWESFVILFGSEYSTKHDEKALKTLNSLVKNKNIVVDPEDVFEKIPEWVTNREGSIYRSSPFYFKAMDIIATNKTICRLRSKCKNEHYIIGLPEHFARKYMFNLPFWTNYFGHRIDEACDRDSNQPGEIFFNLIKNFQAGGRSSLRVPEAIEHFEVISGAGEKKCEINSIGISSSTKVLLKKLNGNPSKSSDNSIDTVTQNHITHNAIKNSMDKHDRKSSPKVSNDLVSNPRNRKETSDWLGDMLPEDELHAEESWDKKPKKRKFTYYDGYYLGRAAKTFKRN